MAGADHPRDEKTPSGIHGGQPRPPGGWANTCAAPRRSAAKHRDRPAARLALRQKAYDDLPLDSRGGRRRPGSLSGRK